MSQPVSKSASALGSGVVVQKQKAGVYTVLLVLALLAILVGCALLYAVINRYDGKLAPGAQAQPKGRAAYQLIDVRTASYGDSNLAGLSC